jgi:hypothetical protein
MQLYDIIAHTDEGTSVVESDVLEINITERMEFWRSELPYGDIHCEVSQTPRSLN